MTTDIWQVILSFLSAKEIIISSRVSVQFNNIMILLLQNRKMINFPRILIPLIHHIPYNFQVDPFLNKPWDVIYLYDYLTQYLYNNNINAIRADLISYNGDYYVFDGIKILDINDDNFMNELKIIQNGIPIDYWKGFKIKLEVNPY